MPKKFDLIVFDWDGTLMDSTAHIAASIQNACRDLGLPVPESAVARHVIGLGLSDALSYAVPQLTPEMLPRMVERYRHHYFLSAETLELFPGVREMLVALKEAGHFVAVGTGKNRIGLNRALDQCGLNPLFDATRTADESRSKPNPQMLFDLTDQLGVDMQRTLMIGDTTHDILMASNARTVAVGVSYGAHPEQELRAANPIALVHSSTELHHWLLDNA